ncbi:hypothetical protein J0X19_15500 [Hymenobacter sp. BT186]|uniref:Uncharacterized protein n=1 Tax=Hymenobacter telluris TaxID=2816474 RepID=A0A939JDX3_9BACT|nr:hypothetical protein [Hymenobacter telluris]MBO0359368.1 hypothetical protein [Hymenobacter telluris]MBW3375394.1 hypothetical protein [Hymenobacter norwichensis]
MNLPEKLMRIGSLLLVLCSLGLRLSHSISASDGQTLLTFGLLLGLLSYSSYSRRLRRHNQELQELLEQGQKQPVPREYPKL